MKYNNSIYEGDWVDGRKEGKGKMTWTDGHREGGVYEGDFDYDNMHGIGKYTYINNIMKEILNSIFSMDMDICVMERVTI